MRISVITQPNIRIPVPRSAMPQKYCQPCSKNIRDNTVNQWKGTYQHRQPCSEKIRAFTADQQNISELLEKTNENFCVTQTVSENISSISLPIKIRVKTRNHWEYSQQVRRSVLTLSTSYNIRALINNQWLNQCQLYQRPHLQQDPCAL